MTCKEITDFFFLNITLSFQNKEETKHVHVNVQLAMKELLISYKEGPHNVQPQEYACSVHQQPKNSHPGWLSKQQRVHLPNENAVAPWPLDQREYVVSLSAYLHLYISGPHLIYAGSHPASKWGKKYEKKQGIISRNRAWEQRGYGGNTV